MRRSTVLIENVVVAQQAEAWEPMVNMHISVALILNVLIYKEAYDTFFPMAFYVITPRLHNHWVALIWTLNTLNCNIFLFDDTFDAEHTFIRINKL